MTQSTEQERAAFEAWYIAGARKAVPAFAEWSEIEIREGCMRPDSGSYRIDSARIAWDAWQAARRAQVVAVPQGLREAAQRAHDWMERQQRQQSKGGHATFDMMMLREERDALAEALAAAPQPPEADLKRENPATNPEAAPVQMPDALLSLEVDAHYIFNNPPGECPQAVRDVIEWYAGSIRQLLADHGIQEQST